MKPASFPKRALALLLGAVLALALGLAPALSAAQAARPESFADLVQQVAPAVVNIRTVKTVKRGPMGGPFPFSGQGQGQDGSGEDTPDLHEFFRRFFGGPGGPGFPGMPRGFRQRSLGSGVIVDKEGYVLTNNHVVADADEIVIALQSGDEMKAEIMGRDKKTDLALVKIKAGKDLPLLNLGDSDAIRVGDWVLAVGNPFGLESTVTAGIVSAKGRIIGAGPYDDFLQTDASINPGNSGGPLVNLRGEVVGINTAIVAQGQGIGFAIPAHLVKEIMNQLRNKGRVVRGWLGVVIQPVTRELADKFKLKDTDGVLVADVAKDGPADKAGIVRGDVIMEFNGKPVKDWHALPRVVAETPMGTKTEVKIIRDGRPKILSVVVGELKEEKAVAAAAELPGKIRLGLSLQELSPELAEQLGIPAKNGLVVTGVESGSPAEDAGLRRGDVILEAAYKSMTKLEDFAALAGRLAPGEGILFLIQRREGTIFVVVKASEK
jgi:serine protease Do